MCCNIEPTLAGDELVSQQALAVGQDQLSRVGCMCKHSVPSVVECISSLSSIVCIAAAAAASAAAVICSRRA
jgi:hypothetical protein